jgi:hypothetical protein
MLQGALIPLEPALSVLLTGHALELQHFQLGQWGVQVQRLRHFRLGQ